MHLTYIPLLQTQRDLYTMPRGVERFQAYLGTMVDGATNDLKLPLVGMNPMGKEHILPLLERLLALDADDIAARATAEAQVALAAEAGTFKVALVLSDDALGGWTNRYASEFAQRCGEEAHYKRGWATATLWTSEQHTPELVREAVLTSLYRLAYIQRHGYARSLAELLAQEGHAMARAGATSPTLDKDDLAYSEEILAPSMAATDQPTLLAALFGDDAARELGYPPLGLSARAGLALALWRATR